MSISMRLPMALGGKGLAKVHRSPVQNKIRIFKVAGHLQSAISHQKIHRYWPGSDQTLVE